MAGAKAPPAIVDAHHHLYELNDPARHRYPWLQDEVDPHFFMGDYAPIRRSYLAADYRADTARQNIVATVHVEAERARDDQVGETEWLEQVHAAEGFPDAIVAHAWFHTPNAADILAAQASHPLVRGIRSKPVTAATPDAPFPRGAGSMHDENWLRGYALLERHGLSWDPRVPYWHLKEAAEVARAFPRTPVVLNHTGFPWDRSAAGIDAWREAMEVLAMQPNVHVKVSEFGLKDAPWELESNRAVVLETIRIFGMHRCMFASNFPVAGLRIGYDALVAAMQDIVSPFSDDEQDAFFRRNALAFYRIELS